MTIEEFVAKNRVAIDDTLARRINMPTINPRTTDADRVKAVLADSHLSDWARREGVEVSR